MTSVNIDCGSQPATVAPLTAPDAMFRRLVECAGLGIGWSDLAGKVIYMNPALRRMLDLAPEADVGGFDLRCFRTLEAEPIIESMLSATRELGSWSGEIDLLSAQGRIIQTRHDVHLLRDDAGVPIAIACSITDLSQQKQQEQKLQRSKAKYRALVENIPQSVFYKDLQSRYLAVNRRYAGEMGVAPQDMVGQDDYAFHPKELADKYRLDDQRVMASGQVEVCDEPYVRAGQELTIHTIKSPVRDNAGEVIGICGIFSDVTEQRRLEARLQESEATLRAIYENAQEGIMVASVESRRLIMANPAICRMLGYSEAELLTMTPMDLHPPEALPRVRQTFQAMEQGDFSLHQEMPFLRKDNGVFYADVSPTYLLIQGKPCFLGVFRDVTERRLVLAQLRDERNFSGAVLDNAGALLLVLDREGRICRFNRACEALSGYTFAEVEGRCAWDFLLLPEERDRVREHVLLALNDHPEELARKFTNYWLDKSGGRHLLEWYKAPLLDDRGRLEYLVSIGIDITEKQAVEDTLRRSEETYARAEAIAHLGSWDWDIVNGTLRWTDEIYRIFGQTPQSFGASYQAFLEAIHPDDRQRVIDAVNASVADASVPYSVEHRVIRPDGEIRSVQERGQVYRDERGMPVRMIGSVHDITEQKRAEAELARYRDHLEELIQERTAEVERQSRRNTMIVNAAIDGFFTAGADGRVNDCNEAYCRLLGYSREELLRLHIADIEADETPEEMAAHIGKIVEQGRDRFETRHRCKDGSLIHVEVSVTLAPIDGDPLIFAFVQDISERKQAENALLRNQTMLTRTEGIAHIGSWEWDVATDTVFWSDELFRIFQRNPADRAPSLAEQSELYQPEDMQRLMEASMAAVNLGTPYELELRAIRKDGTSRVCLARGYAERGTDHRVVRLFGSLQDITDRKLAEVEILRAKVEAERANQAKSEFLSRMSHELRTPLNAILGFGQLLERAKLAGVQAENVQEVLHAGRHLLELINEVLDLARIESGKFTISLEPVALMPLVTDCISLIRPQAENWGIDLIETVQDCRQQVRADRTRLKQVLLNLLSNAVKYNRPHGAINVTCTLQGDAVRIRISDTGAGLTAEQQARLFVAFERLDADNSAIEGTGIGLALSKRLVELMGGTIGVESEPGAGSTFWVSLPIADGAAVAARSVVPASEAAMQQPVALRQFDILYIEDNPANLRLVECILGQRADIRLLSSSAPGLGLELAQAHRPALILLDINLPEMDGYAVLRHLRENPATRPIPVVAVSANAMTDDLARGMAAGFYEYLTKPLDVDRLLRVVSDVISQPVPTIADMSNQTKVQDGRWND